MAMLRFGIVGLGYIGKYHALGAVEAPGTTLVAGFDPDPEKRAAFLKIHPEARVYADAAAMAAAPDVDAVAIGVPNVYHRPLAETFLRAGKHVLMEKPMAMNATEARPWPRPRGRPAAPWPWGTCGASTRRPSISGA